MKNFFKKSEKKSSISNLAAEKLNATELKQVMGGSINYNASKSNTGNVTVDPTTGSGNGVNSTNQAGGATIGGNGS